MIQNPGVLLPSNGLVLFWYCWCHLGLRVAKLVFSQEKSLANPRLLTGLFKKTTSLLWYLFCPNTEAKCLMKCFFQLFPCNCATATWPKGKKVLISIKCWMSTIWKRGGTLQLSFIFSSILSCCCHCGWPFAWHDTELAHPWKHEHRRLTAVFLIFYSF